MKSFLAHRRLGLAWLVAASLTARPGAGAALPDRKDAWNRVDTAHFTLFADAATARAREIGLELEKLRAVLATFLPSASQNAPVPTQVFVFKSDAALDPYKPLYKGKPTGATGFFQGTPEGNFIALTASWNADPRPVVFHEFLHYFLHSNFPPQPLWYDEGLADFYSTFRATSRQAKIGLPVEHHIWRLRGEAMLPLATLFAVSRESPEYNEQSRQGIFYAESWALVHYLMRGSPRRATQLPRFLTLLQEGKPQDEAFREAFGVDYAGLQGELSRYVQQASFPYRRVAYEELKLPSETKTAPISYGEALCHLGDLLVHGSPDHLADARAHFEAALALEPGNPDALGGLGLIRLREDRTAEARDLLGRALAAGSTDFRVPFHLGQLAMRSLSGKPFSPGHLEPALRAQVDLARGAFRKAVEENPDFAQGRAELGRTFLFETGPDVSEGISELEAAVARLPGRRDLLLDLASLYDQGGNRARHEELLRKALGPEAEALLERRRKQEDLEASLARVHALLADSQDDAAIDLIERMAAAIDPDSPARLPEELQTLRRQSARNRAIHRYNDAVARYGRRELAAALSGFEAVAATAEDPELAGTAREQARWVRHLIAQARTKKSAPARK